MENPTFNSGDAFGAAESANADAVKRGVESAGAALHSSIDKIVDPAFNTVERVTTAAHDTVNRLASGATHVADRMAEQANRVSDASGRAVESSKSWIQDKPLEAVGMALALGFIIGRLTAH
ncbi:MAG: hypothetical protein H7273_06890 [Polaromonas sp.]|nr:hypothetical protein [Polaromonas sp.]